MPPADNIAPPTRNGGDRHLIAGCLDGDAEAQTLLVRRFSNLVYASVLGTLKSKSKTLSENDIEDLHSTVFVRLFERGCRKLAQYQGRNGCSLASWIRMITVRTVLDHLRRRKDALAHEKDMVPLEAVADLAVTCPSPWDCLAAKERERCLEAGLAVLAPRDRLLIRMHCLEGCSLQQTAQVLQVSDANIHSVKHRAVQRLKRAVDKIVRQETDN